MPCPAIIGAPAAGLSVSPSSLSVGPTAAPAHCGSGRTAQVRGGLRIELILRCNRTVAVGALMGAMGQERHPYLSLITLKNTAHFPLHT